MPGICTDEGYSPSTMFTRRVYRGTLSRALNQARLWLIILRKKVSMTVSQAQSKDPAKNSGESGKGRILFRVFVQQSHDVGSLAHKLKLILDDSVVREMHAKSKDSFLVIEINEDQEEYLERLLEYSSVVVSGHRLEKTL